MKLAYVEISGFRGYRKAVRFEFSDSFTIIDGRNGVGKSTIFDAIEFVLTGDIAKYDDARADGESVADYIWWSEEGPRPEAFYVEAGFNDGHKMLAVRRSQLSRVNEDDVSAIVNRLCDQALAPEHPLKQLLASSIIRDEHIAKLSLDLKEADRYQKLRDAIGATDADVWIARAHKLQDRLQARMQSAQDEVARAEGAHASASRRIDELRRGLTEEATLAAAAARLSSFIGSAVPIDQLAGPARTQLAAKTLLSEKLESLQAAWGRSVDATARLVGLQKNLEKAAFDTVSAEEALDVARAALDVDEPVGDMDISQRARDIALLVEVGTHVGLHDEACPLCRQSISEADFAESLKRTLAYANELNERSVLRAQRQRLVDEAENKLIALRALTLELTSLVAQTNKAAQEYADSATALGFEPNIAPAAVQQSQEALLSELKIARNDLQIIETLKLNADLQTAVASENTTRESYAKAQEKLSQARRSHSNAHAIYDAARRAAGETLGRRLERVLPLMAELYQRLRPHPVWTDLEYKIRGDVRRFLKLQVGGDLNPQFMFSSGQRRATGLAFLLSVNLSLAWSRWRSVLLDDPVQHIDDFRSIQLAEVLAQLVADGRQIICAVEDAALAELLCRRLISNGTSGGRRITLGTDEEGALTKSFDQLVSPLSHRVLVPSSNNVAI